MKFNFTLTKNSSSKRDLLYSFHIENEYAKEIWVWEFLKRVGINRVEYIDYAKSMGAYFPDENHRGWGDSLKPYFYNKKICKKFISYLEGCAVMQTLMGESEKIN